MYRHSIIFPCALAALTILGMTSQILYAGKGLVTFLAYKRT